jgi:hypothetical protein
VIRSASVTRSVGGDHPPPLADVDVDVVVVVVVVALALALDPSSTGVPGMYRGPTTIGKTYS